MHYFAAGEFLEQEGQGVERISEFPGERFGVAGLRGVGGDEDEVGDLLERVIDAFGESVGDGGSGGSRPLAILEALALLVGDAEGGEAAEDLHHVEICLVECLRSAVRQEPDGAAGSGSLPGKQKAVGYGEGQDLVLFEERLIDAKELGAISLKEGRPGGGGAGEQGVEEGFVLAGGCDPLVVGVSTLVGALEADAGAVGTTEIDGGVDQLLEDGVGGFDDGSRQTLHADGLAGGVMGVQLPLRERGEAVKIHNFQALGICSQRIGLNSSCEVCGFFALLCLGL